MCNVLVVSPQGFDPNEKGLLVKIRHFVNDKWLFEALGSIRLCRIWHMVFSMSLLS